MRTQKAKGPGNLKFKNVAVMTANRILEEVKSKVRANVLPNPGNKLKKFKVKHAGQKVKCQKSK